MVLSMLVNADATRSRDLLDGRPGFFGASADVRVDGCEVPSSINRSEVDDCTGGGGTDASGVGPLASPVSSQMVGLVVRGEASRSEALSEELAGSRRLLLVPRGRAGG
jgi:hypothetical protein